jgi:hypothetical protein
MSRTSSLVSLSAPLLALAVGCAPADELEFRDTYGCVGCGSNSPRVNDFLVPELHVDGEPNEDGVTVLGIRAPNQTLHRLAVDNDEFAAYDANNLRVGVGEDLIGWDIVLSDGVDTTELHIRAHDAEIDSWATGGAPISAYALAYETGTAPVETVNVCPAVRDDPDALAVTLISGEIYRRDEKVVIPEQPGWVTLACEDEAVFKMKLMNYGPSDDFDNGAPASPDQRQATIKMITADYCGTGESFTAQGTPLLWKNAGETVSTGNLPPGAAIEARWDRNGAVCLGRPRLAEPEDVQLVCPLPVCDPHDPLGAAEWFTWTP